MQNTLLRVRSAKASCAAVVRAAQGFVEDVGAAAATKSGGLLKLAQRTEHNAERDCHHLLAGEFQLTLPVPITDLKTSTGLTLPVLRFRDWMQMLVNGNHTHIMVGLLKPDWRREEAILNAFWDTYRVQCPTHPVFQEALSGNLSLGRTFPLIFHGDEGRGRKHNAYLAIACWVEA